MVCLAAISKQDLAIRTAGEDERATFELPFYIALFLELALYFSHVVCLTDGLQGLTVRLLSFRELDVMDDRGLDRRGLPKDDVPLSLWKYVVQRDRVIEVMLPFVITVFADDVADAGIIHIGNMLAVTHDGAHLGL